MKHHLTLLLLTACALAFTACDTKKQKEQSQEASAAIIDSLQQVINQTQNESNDLMGMIDQIQDGFRQINEAEGRVGVETKDGAVGNRQAIVENMNFIQRTLRLNRELIANLQQQLRNSNQTNAKMKSTIEEMAAGFNAQLEEKTQEIAELRAQLEAKDIKIAELDERVTSLNQNVDELSASNAEKDKNLAAQDKEINTAWYVFGTKKELAAQNILKRGEYVFGTKKELAAQNILKRGDVLTSGDFNKDYFTQIDLRVTKVVRLYSKSAKIMTTHPAGSYSLDKDAQGQYTLRISDPQKFWSVSKYLVIVVK